MLKTASGFLLLFLLLILPNTINAKVNVQISGNGEGASSNVQISSSTSTSNESSNDSSNSTDIRIETNGEVKEYHGTGDQNIVLQSENGKNTVSVTVNSSSAPSSLPGASSPVQPAASSSASPSPSPSADNKSGLIGFLKNELKIFLEFFKF